MSTAIPKSSSGIVFIKGIMHAEKEWQSSSLETGMDEATEICSQLQYFFFFFFQFPVSESIKAILV